MNIYNMNMLKWWREDKNLTPSQAAKQLKTTRQNYAYWEKTGVPEKYIKHASKVTGLSEIGLVINGYEIRIGQLDKE